MAQPRSFEDIGNWNQSFHFPHLFFDFREEEGDVRKEGAVILVAASRQESAEEVEDVSPEAESEGPGRWTLEKLHEEVEKAEIPEELLVNLPRFPLLLHEAFEVLQSGEEPAPLIGVHVEKILLLLQFHSE